MSFVLDCSVALAWILPDEGEHQVAALLEKVGTEGAIVPEVWPLEVANALLVAQHRRRLKEKDVERALADLAALPIRVDQETHQHALRAILSLAREYKLSAYDAAYLELARRARMPLATLDKNLRSACRAAGIEVL
ncbi:MAG: type II toxin-antitoxin system VapC family toxin [Thermoleophilia bacterium]